MSMPNPPTALRRPKNILLLVSSMNSGGAERVAANLVNAWAARGDTVSLLVTFSGRGESVYPLSDRVRLTYLADLVGRTERSSLTYWLRFWALRKFIRTTRPDVVVSFLTNVNVAAILATRGLCCHVIACERTYPPMLTANRLWDPLRRYAYPLAFRTAMLTTEGLHWLENHIPKAKGVVIPNPVLYPLPKGEPVLPPARFIAPERRLLLAVGRMNAGQQKQFDRLLEAFAALAQYHPSWDLVILGDGSERSQLKQQVAALGLQQRASLPGRVGNVGEWYSRADLYVMTSRFEGFPNSLAEAMAHGSAAVSYDCETGPRDIIRHEHDGLLVTPVGDIPALIRALDRLMGDEAERQRMSLQAMEVRERYSLEKILAIWDAVFEQCK